MPLVISKHSHATTDKKKNCGCKDKQKQEATANAVVEPDIKDLLMSTHDSKEHEPANVAEIVAIGGEA